MGEALLYREGDRVFHRNMGAGTVISSEGGTVRIAYDNAQPPRRDGKPAIGVYDDAWFRRSGHLLSATGKG